MKTSILKYFAPKKTNSDFSEFFLHATSADKKKVLLKAVKEANKDQKQMLDRYQSKAA